MGERLLFNKLPSTLFAPLAAKESLLYSEVLLSLFVETQRHQEPLSRDLCVTLTADVIEDQGALAGMASLDDEQELFDPGDLRGKAGAVLRYLTRCQWLSESIQPDFTVAYTIPDYAFRLLTVFYDLATNTKQSLQGIICNIHDLLQNAVQQGNLSVRVPQAHQETQRLLNGLKELQHNINVHIEEVLREKNLKDILEQTFTSRLQQVTRRAYHELRTTDHVSRFRPEIGSSLRTLAVRYHEALDERAQHNSASTPETLSMQRLLAQLSAIQDQFDTLDELLDAIDIRHSLFFDSAIRSIEYRLSANTSTSGHLRTSLEFLLRPQPSRASETDEDAAQNEAETLFNLYSLSLLDEKSLMSPRRAAEPFVPAPDTSREPSAIEIENARRGTFEQLHSMHSRDRVREYALSLLAGSDERRIGELPIHHPDELPMLIYLRLYGEDGSLGYRTVELDDAPWIEHAEIGFRDFLIRRT